MQPKFPTVLAAALVVGVIAAGGSQSGKRSANQDDILIGLSVPSQSASVAPEQSGSIVRVPVRDGDLVAKDDVLFELSARLQRLEVERLRELAESDLIELRAKAGLNHAKRRASRVGELRDMKLSSESDLQDQTYEVEVAELRLSQAKLEKAQAANEYEQAKERLAQRTLKSPIDGIVTRRFKQVGETVEKFDPVVEVTALDPLWIEFDAPVADDRLYRIGTEITISPSVRPDAVRKARIIYTSVKANPSSHTYLVRAAVSNPKRDWKAGLKILVRRPRPAAAKPGK